ncbi:MAG: 4-hydroxybenzoate octaprenyltransferase [Pseudomonadota bacterium]
MTGPVKTAATDTSADGWVDRFAPAALRPYLKLARLDRPVGIWLLFLPCAFGVTIASPAWPDPFLLFLFAMGAVLMRSAGCTLNDIVDRDIDRQVARTRNRPLPSGAVSLANAYFFLGGLLLASFGVLLCFNRFTVLLGLASLVLVVLYPFAKRYTDWPQAILGLTFNWGAFLGWTAVKGGLDLAAFALYAGAFFWTLGYDTIYACQDKADDLRIGVRSTALLLKERARVFLLFAYGAAVLFFAGAGWLAGLAWPFYAGLVGLAAQLLWQAAGVRTAEPADCLRKFRSNAWAGLLLAAALLAAKAFP